MRLFSRINALLIFATVVLFLLPAVSNAGSTQSDPENDEPQSAECGSDDESGSEEIPCECLRELPPPCPEPEETIIKKTDTGDELKTVVR